MALESSSSQASRRPCRYRAVCTGTVPVPPTSTRLTRRTTKLSRAFKLGAAALLLVGGARAAVALYTSPRGSRGVCVRVMRRGGWVWVMPFLYMHTCCYFVVRYAVAAPPQARMTTTTSRTLPKRRLAARSKTRLTTISVSVGTSPGNVIHRGRLLVRVHVAESAPGARSKSTASAAATA